MSILVVGGDSVGTLAQGIAADTRTPINHWSGRKTRDLSRAIPKATDAVILILDRVNHALAKKVRVEAGRLGLPVYYRKRSRAVGSSVRQTTNLLGLHSYNGSLS
ncbi:dihydroorotate dehydrogenase [Nitrospira sp. KM1]|uniref:DUF2325 domain-containing protein n=1 Tax=Nitrospira sp. KM1 TaxID=1936990 RepID=UPI0013A73B82|nr:DUF2325 domain-containing protein [Nitrospira sp. KM1]BCA53012.1 dihydroorotate dehydrogenase [Nitrospira sp. KM1]